MDPGLPAEDRVLTAALAAFGVDEDRYWELIFELEDRSDDDTFLMAAQLTGSNDPKSRAVGLDVLGRLGAVHDHPWKESTIPIAVAATADEDPAVIASAISALGHLNDKRGLEAILHRAAHPSVDIRRHVALAIAGPAGDPPDPRAVDVVIALMRDPDDFVRDWATFVLGTQFSTDGATIRRALWGCLDDEDPDVRGEALVGLARRHAPNVVDSVARELEADSCGRLVFEAAGFLKDEHLLDALALWSRSRPDDPDVVSACRECDPAFQDERLAAQVALLDELDNLASARPDSPAVAMYCETAATGWNDPFGSQVLIQIGSDDTRAWEVDSLLERAQRDPAGAAALAFTDWTGVD